MWVFFRIHCFCQTEKYAIAGDEVVTTKSGKQTYGMDWFFSGLAQRPVKGLAFFALSLVGLEPRQSYPLRIEQVIRPVSENKATPQNAAPQTKRRRGRPKGSKNKDKTQVNLSSELLTTAHSWDAVGFAKYNRGKYSSGIFAFRWEVWSQ